MNPAPHLAGRAAPSSGAALPLPWAIGIVLLVAALWFLTLDARHLLRSDEGRYAEIAREMFASGDWVTIRYNGLKYFEKPPFQLWMTALAFKAFGLGEWQARWWVAASGAAGLLLTALAARRWFGPRVGLLSALVLLAAPGWNVGSHFNSLDMGVSGALAAVLAGVLMAQHPQATAAQRRHWMLFAWAAMAVAVLTKGLIGIVLPGLVLVVYTLWSRDLSLWGRLHIVRGTLLFLALSAPWFVLVAQRNPEFMQFFFIHEHWQRYTSGVHQRGAPAWYFVPQLLGGVLPWLGLLPGAVAAVRAEPRAPGLQPLKLLAAWALAIFVFFSLSSSKLPGYILPVYPALAVLLALALDRLSARGWSRQLVAALIVTVLLMLAAPLAGRLGSETTPNAAMRAYVPWLVAAAAVMVAGVLLARRLHGQGRLQASLLAYALAMFGGATVGLLGHETLGRGASGIDLVPRIQAVLKPDMPIYGLRLLDHTLPFYLQRTLVMAEEPDELAFGTEQEPQKWLATHAAFVERWRSGPPALALMSHDTFKAMRAEGLPMNAVASDERRVVVANFPVPTS
jgi:4-amino-4-deoxy-L-arabinose transferase-like glycosyltransferase